MITPMRACGSLNAAANHLPTFTPGFAEFLLSRFITCSQWASALASVSVPSCSRPR